MDSRVGTPLASLSFPRLVLFIVSFLRTNMSIYEDPSINKLDKSVDEIAEDVYIYTPGTVEEKKLVRKIDIVRSRHSSSPRVLLT